MPIPPLRGPSQPADVADDFSLSNRPSQSLIIPPLTSIEPWLCVGEGINSPEYIEFFDDPFVDLELCQSEYNKKSLKGHNLGTQETLGNILDENFNAVESATSVTPVISHGTTTTPATKGGASSPRPH